MAAALLVLGGVAQASPIPTDLETTLQVASPAERIPVVVSFHSDEVSGLGPARAERVMRARATKRRPLLSGLKARVSWLSDTATLQATPRQVREIAALPEVERVEPATPVTLQAAKPVVPDFAWNVLSVGGGVAWNRYAVSGRGVRVAFLDSGADANHPALRGAISGWRDFVKGRTTPYDDMNHGTGVVAAALGRRAEGLTLGVAPQASALVAKVIGPNDLGANPEMFDAAAEWVANPDGDPATADQPIAVNCSFKIGPSDTMWMRRIVQGWRALGIIPVMAAGNDGPAAGTIAAPASYPESLAVGAIDVDRKRADFSSAGPATITTDEGPITVDKPDLVAPGEGSEVADQPSMGVGSGSGTSMAAPVVSGVIALLHEANPRLGAEELINVLRATARDLGPVGSDPVYGAGEVDAERALAAVYASALPIAPVTRIGTLPAKVRSPKVSLSADTRGIAGVRVSVDGGGWSAPRTGPRMTIPLYEQGRHVLEFQAVTDDGRVDPQIRRRVVAVDGRGPQLKLTTHRRGNGVVVSLRAKDRGLAGVAAGARWVVQTPTRRIVTRRPVSRPLILRSNQAGATVSVRVADRMGNHSSARVKVPSQR